MHKLKSEKETRWENGYDRYWMLYQKLYLKMK